MNRRLALVTLSISILLGSSANSRAGDDEDKKLIVGTWQTLIGTEFVFRMDGTYSDPTTKGEWNIKGGKLVRTFKILGVPIVEEDDYALTRNTLRIGDLLPMTRKR